MHWVNTDPRDMASDFRKKCDYCGVPSENDFGGGRYSDQPTGYACDAHFDFAFDEYVEIYGHPKMLYQYMINYNKAWWEEKKKRKKGIPVPPKRWGIRL